MDRIINDIPKAKVSTLFHLFYKCPLINKKSFILNRP